MCLLQHRGFSAEYVRRVYSFIKGQIAANDENWNKFLFSNEMKKLDIVDSFRRVFYKEDIVNNMI